MQEVTVEDLKLVKAIANRFSVPHVWLDDLISDGNYGLAKAAKTFQPTESGMIWRSYAARHIKFAMIDGMRSRSHYRNGKHFKNHHESISLDNFLLSSDDKLIDTQMPYTTDVYPLEADAEQLLSQIKLALPARWVYIILSQKGQLQLSKELGVSQAMISDIKSRAIKRLQKLQLI